MKTLADLGKSNHLARWASALSSNENFSINASQGAFGATVGNSHGTFPIN
jgi:hypothetical protein